MKAFTLIEMVVSVTIIAIIAVAAMISFSTLSARKLEADTRKIVSDLSLLRELAVSTRKDHCVMFNSTYYNIYADSCGAAGTLIRRGSLEVSVANPSVPFELTFCSSNSTYCKSAVPTNYILGGMAYSAQSTNNELNITLDEAGSIENVRIFEHTGYVKIE